jgi:hypothetical protein
MDPVVHTNQPWKAFWIGFRRLDYQELVSVRRDWHREIPGIEQHGNPRSGSQKNGISADPPSRRRHARKPPARQIEREGLSSDNQFNAATAPRTRPSTIR